MGKDIVHRKGRALIEQGAQEVRCWYYMFRFHLTGAVSACIQLRSGWHTVRLHETRIEY
jgi:hypothetical protein